MDVTRLIMMKNDIERTFNKGQAHLEKRKSKPVDAVQTEGKDQRECLIEVHQANFDELLETVLIEERSAEQLLKYEDPFLLIRMANNIQQCQQDLRQHAYHLQ